MEGEGECNLLHLGNCTTQHWIPGWCPRLPPPAVKFQLKEPANHYSECGSLQACAGNTASLSTPTLTQTLSACWSFACLIAAGSYVVGEGIYFKKKLVNSIIRHLTTVWEHYYRKLPPVIRREDRPNMMPIPSWITHQYYILKECLCLYLHMRYQSVHNISV